MRAIKAFVLIALMALAADASAQSCASTQGQLEYCKALTNAVRFGFPRYTTVLLPACSTNNKGAVAYDTTTDTVKYCTGSAWTAVGTPFTGGTITTPILAPAANNCSAVPYSFTGATDTGVCSPSAGATAMRAGGYNMITCDNVGCANLGYFDTPSLLLSSQTYLKSDAANTLALRNSTNAQTFNWYYSYTDASNYHRGALKTSASGIEIAAETAGSGADNLNIVLNPAGGGQVQFNAGGGGPYWYVSGVDGSFNTGFTDTVDLNGARNVGIIRSIQGSKTKTLTEGAATAVTQIAVPQTAGSNSADAVVQWTVYASDGTDTQTRRGSTYLAAVNAAGTETCTVGDIGTPVVAVSAGTLTCATSCITGLTDVVQFALDCTSSLTQTTLNALVRLDMDQPNTVTPQ